MKNSPRLTGLALCLLLSISSACLWAQTEAQARPLPPLEKRIAPELLDAYHKMSPMDLSPGGLINLRGYFTALVGSNHLPTDPAVTVYDTHIHGKSPGEKIRLRIYRPVELPEKACGIYWIHGGGFLFGAPEQDEAQSIRWAKEIGAVVVAVDYRLAPEHPYPAPLDDCYAGLVWFAREAESLGVDKNRLAVAGASAGGGLTASVTLMARDLGGPALAFQMPLYPMIDDRFQTPASREKFGRKIWNNGDNHLATVSYNI